VASQAVAFTPGPVEARTRRWCLPVSGRGACHHGSSSSRLPLCSNHWVHGAESSAGAPSATWTATGLGPNVLLTPNTLDRIDAIVARGPSFHPAKQGYGGVALRSGASQREPPASAAIGQENRAAAGRPRSRCRDRTRWVAAQPGRRWRYLSAAMTLRRSRAALADLTVEGRRSLRARVAGGGVPSSVPAGMLALGRCSGLKKLGTVDAAWIQIQGRRAPGRRARHAPPLGDWHPNQCSSRLGSRSCPA
jgi:hypothetical protein